MSEQEPNAEEVFALVKEFTERLDRMRLAGSIVVQHDLAAAGRIELRGDSAQWIRTSGGFRCPPGLLSGEATRGG